MTSEEFKYWISGYLHLSSDEYLHKQQINIIKNHANLVEAVTGNIDKEICDFIAELDHEYTHSRLSLTKMKELAKLRFFSIYK